MPNRRISLDLKERAIVLREDGWSYEEVVAALGVSESSIRRWEVLKDETGSLETFKRLRGRTSLLTPAVDDELRTLIKETPSLYLDELALWLALQHDIRISPTALQMNLCRLQLSRKVLIRTAAERDEESRDEWRADLAQNFGAPQLVFLDESSKDGHTVARRFGRAPQGERATEPAIHDRGERWSILPALSLDGYVAVRAVPGSVDGLDLYEFVVDDLVCSCLHMVCDGVLTIHSLYDYSFPR